MNCKSMFNRASQTGQIRYLCGEIGLQLQLDGYQARLSRLRRHPGNAHRESCPLCHYFDTAVSLRLFKCFDRDLRQNGMTRKTPGVISQNCVPSLLWLECLLTHHFKFFFCHRYLNDNALTGPIPSEISTLTKLVDLYAPSLIEVIEC